VANALEVRNLTVRFGPDTILRDLSFDVEAASALAVIGPNGAGKTVLFKTLAGLIPHAGTVTWAKGTRLGYVPQKLDLERDLPLTGRDFLGAMVQVSRPGAMEMEQVLAAVRMDASVADRLIGTLSGGQFQRLLMASALLGRPNVLLLDEATAGIDEPGQELIQEVVHRLQKERGMTVLLISHELRIVYRYADNVLCLSHEAVFCGPPREILTSELLARVFRTEPRFHIHDHDAG